MRHYDFHPEAREELWETVRYYDSSGIGLGDEFVEEVAKSISRILAFPELWQPIAPGIRRCRTKRFPYGLVYKITGEGVLILAVMHLRREPGYWSHRT
ncbi:MAG: type II toxin-antitoxin system RelE/ParE family toxin [Verrucomicrobia bacterium]|nr:type II toxin-antitoxin system RelE/ParE family toxin [Verrucomicrobiota bacterium]